MKKMQLILSILFIIAMFFYVADTTITFSPFTFKCASLGRAFGCALLAAGLVVLNEYNYRRGVHDGVEAAKTAVMDIIKEYKPADTTTTE